jgi:hypothetical protein
VDPKAEVRPSVSRKITAGPRKTRSGEHHKTPQILQKTITTQGQLSLVRMSRRQPEFDLFLGFTDVAEPEYLHACNVDERVASHLVGMFGKRLD